MAGLSATRVTSLVVSSIRAIQRLEQGGVDRAHNGDYFDWWQRRLAYDGYALRVEAIVNRQTLYVVER